jgi:hypothetical protein
MVTLKSLVAVSSTAVALLTVACGGGSTASSASCEQTKDCPAPASSTRTGKTDTSLGDPSAPVPDGTTAPTPTTAPTTKPSTPPGPPGQECTTLLNCCGVIKSSGADSSVCEAAVARLDEAACTKAYSGYTTYGPCTPPAPPGPECTDLGTCCAEIKASGADSSVCEGAVARRDEVSCSKALVGYKAYGPCL